MKKLFFHFISNFILDKHKRHAFRAWRCNDARLRNNKIFLIKDGQKIPTLPPPGLECICHGRNAEICIEYPCVINNLFCQIEGDNAKVFLGKNTWINNLRITILFGQNQFIHIGEGTSIDGATVDIYEDSGLEIGKNCMLSNHIRIMTGDGHAVEDLSGGNIINGGKHIVALGNHVWMGRGSFLTKNASIAAGSIVAAGAVVTKAFNEENCIVGGNPAKVIKRAIRWHREPPNSFQEKEK